MSENRQSFTPVDRQSPAVTDVKNAALEEEKKRILTPEDFARYIEFPNGYPQTLIEVGVARGGTTAMSQVLACSSSFDGYGEDMLRNAVAYPRNRGEEPTTIQMPGEGSHVILKETYGPATESMIGHYPLRALELAAQRAGISKEVFTAKTQLLAVTRDPLAIYNGWLKYWTITRDVTTIEEAFEEYGDISLTNLAEAYSCLTETVLDAIETGMRTHVLVTGIFDNPSQGISGMIKAICDKLGVEFNKDMIMFYDPKKGQKRDIHPVTIDTKYKGLHEDIDTKGFRYFPPNYRYSSEVLPTLRNAGLLSQYKVLHRLAEKSFGGIRMPEYLDEDSQ